MNKWLALGLLLTTVLALALRCPQLGERPMHNDEAVNAVKFGQLWQRGEYRYDPHEFHGPTLAYATLAIEKLTGAPGIDRFTEVRLRGVTVAFGVGLLLLLPLFGDGLGRPALLWAALFTAVSPAMVFYSRYYIHETLLVFFTCVALGGGWRYWRTRQPGWLLLAGAGVGLMQATKETFVISLAAGALASGLCYAWDRWVNAAEPPLRVFRFSSWHLAGGLCVWVGVVVVLFTSFFTNASGLADSVRTYQPWLGRVQGASPHIHPAGFYLHRLLFFHEGRGSVWSEALIFALGIAGALAGFARPRLTVQPCFVRFVACYTVILMAAYSFISYKTPWCLLSFWQGMILLAGVGAAAIGRATQGQWAKAALAALMMGGAGLLGTEAWRASVPFAADPRNPYVYAHTSPDILGLVPKLEGMAEVDPRGHDLRINVIAAEGDYWPLPWYLRRFKQVAWYSEMPADPFAPVMIVSAGLRAGLDAKRTHLMTGYVELRPQAFFEIYVELDLWRAWLATHPVGGTVELRPSGALERKAP